MVKCWVIKVGSKGSMSKKGSVECIRGKSWIHRLWKDTMDAWRSLMELMMKLCDELTRNKEAWTHDNKELEG